MTTGPSPMMGEGPVVIPVQSVEAERLAGTAIASRHVLVVLELRHHIAGEELQRAVPAVGGYPVTPVHQERPEVADVLTDVVELRATVLGAAVDQRDQKSTCLNSSH